MTLIETTLLGAQVVLGLAMLAAGGTKLAGAETHVEDFDRFGYPQWSRLVVGALESIGALALLLAFFMAETIALAGALLAAVVLAGAILTHLKIDDEVSNLVPPAILFVLALLVSWNHVGAL